MDPQGGPPEVMLWALMAFAAYFLFFRPVMNERVAKDKLQEGLAKDDRVVTAGGIRARVVRVEADHVVLDTGGRGELTVDKDKIVRKQAEKDG